jgi:hypothetical protein
VTNPLRHSCPKRDKVATSPGLFNQRATTFVSVQQDRPGQQCHKNRTSDEDLANKGGVHEKFPTTSTKKSVTRNTKITQKQLQTKKNN